MPKLGSRPPDRVLYAVMRRLFTIFLLLTLCRPGAIAQLHNYTDGEGRAKWAELKKNAPTEQNFRDACDLIQAMSRTNMGLAYQMIGEYLPILERTGNHRWVHLMLMVEAKSKVLMRLYDDASGLYRQAEVNAAGNDSLLRSVYVALVAFYSTTGKTDSLNKYFAVAEQQFLKTGDKEALSFIYTFKAQSISDTDTSGARRYLDKAILLARDLTDKNALFSATYDYILTVLQNNPAKQIEGFEGLLNMSRDSTLIPSNKLYNGRLYRFGLAEQTVYHQLAQLNLLLTDYDNAGKYMRMCYDYTVNSPYGKPGIPYVAAYLSIVRAYQGQYAAAKAYLDTSLKTFGVPEDQIPLVNYFIAAGLIAEHDGDKERALNYYAKARTFGDESFELSLVPPGVYYAHGLLLNGLVDSARRVLERFEPGLGARRYSAYGFYYYQCYAELQKALKNYPAYAAALDSFYEVRDSLSNLNRFRAIQVVETRMRVKDEEREIQKLGDDQAAAQARSRRERTFYIVILGIAVLAITFLSLYLRTRGVREKQQEALARSKFAELEKQQHIDIMQSVMEAEENERHKIADQLHNEVNSMLALALLNVSSTIEKGIDDEQSVKRIQKTHDILSSVSTTIRELSHRLTPLIIERYGFRKAIEDMADTVNLSGRIKLEVILVGFEDSGKHPMGLLNDLYRIIQELLQNILKHSLATTATLELVEQDQHVSIIVDDNGVGIGESAYRKGKGLRTIQSKIAYLKGQMEITKKNDQGTLIVIEIPVNYGA